MRIGDADTPYSSHQVPPMHSTILEPEPLALVDEYVNSVWNDGAIAAIDELVAENCVSYGTSFGDVEGPDGVREFVEIARAAFPGLQYDVETITISDDRIELDWVATDGHRSTESHALGGVTTVRVADGKIVETWSDFDPWLAHA